MNKNISPVLALSAVLILGTAGCGHKHTDTQAEIDQAAKAMSQTEAPQPATATPVATPPAPVQQMNDALAAYKSGKYDDAVTRFQTMRAQTPMTGEQLMALNRAIGAVMTDLYARAAKGDAQAQEAIRKYELLQNSPQR